MEKVIQRRANNGKENIQKKKIYKNSWRNAETDLEGRGSSRGESAEPTILVWFKEKTEKENS